MSDERTGRPGEGKVDEGAGGDARESTGEKSEEGTFAEERERVDADGLPLDREPTIDDVRSREARHGRFALGCTLLIVLLILAFWAIRAGVIG